MRSLFVLFVLFILPGVAIGHATCTQTIELTSDNPSTLISTNSSDYTIFGLRLGMSQSQALEVVNRNKLLIAKREMASRIYIHDKGKDGKKGNAILYLIWEPDTHKLGRITIFSECSGYITPNFRRLLTSEAIDDSSAFAKAFIGSIDESKATLDIPSIDAKNTTYYFDKVGIEITRVHWNQDENFVFALVTKDSR